jgi:beta-glucanase (GH16 family)
MNKALHVSRFLWFLVLPACGAAHENMAQTVTETEQLPSHFALSNKTSYAIRPAGAKHLCVDVQHNSRENGAPLQLWECSGAEQQLFTRKGASLQAFGNKCLDVHQGAARAGARVQMWDCQEGSPNQKWTSIGPALQFKGTKFCLDVVNGLYNNGAALQLWSCDENNAHQKFSFEDQSPAPSATQQAQSDRKIVFQDEFDGDAIDTSKWNYEVNCDGGGNNEHQCYTQDGKNAWVKDGMLHIKVIKGKYKNKNYTSARINTAGKGDFTYGRFEARIKVPCGQGLWPAFWMMPTDSNYGSWPTSGELDIMEILGGDADTLHGTAHFGDKWPNNRNKGGSYSMSSGDFCQDFHTYAIERYQDKVVWSLDGKDYFTLKPNDASWSPAPHWPFDKRFFFILNVAMGGNWPGDPDPKIESGEMVVDYVRAYAPK